MFIPSTKENFLFNRQKRYVDDILEKIKAGHRQQLTDHLNTTDHTGKINSTQEEESNTTIAFLDSKIHHKDDNGSISIKIHRKPPHTRGVSRRHKLSLSDKTS